MRDPDSQRRPHHEVIAASHRPTIVFITACTNARRPILANAAAHDALRHAWSNALAWTVGRYVIMPDHIHLFATPGEPEISLEKWIAYWKRLTVPDLGKAIWQFGYWDRTLRSDESYAEKWDYVLQNPVRNGLVTEASDWPFAGEMNVLEW